MLSESARESQAVGVGVFFSFYIFLALQLLMLRGILTIHCVYHFRFFFVSVLYVVVSLYLYSTMRHFFIVLSLKGFFLYNPHIHTNLHLHTITLTHSYSLVPLVFLLIKINVMNNFLFFFWFVLKPCDILLLLFRFLVYCYQFLPDVLL